MISVPYTVYARVVPDRAYGKREEYINDLEKISRYIKDDLDDAGGFVLTESPIAITPQFGNYTARVTIVGFDNINEVNFQPATVVTREAPGVTPSDNYHSPDVANKVVSGYMGTQILDPQGQSLDPRVRTYMLNLKSSLESSSSWLNGIFRLDYMDVIFGQGGYSFQ